MRDNLTKLEQHIKREYGHARRFARYLGYDIKERKDVVGEGRYYVVDWVDDYVFGNMYDNTGTVREILDWLDQKAAERLAQLEQVPAA